MTNDSAFQPCGDSVTLAASVTSAQGPLPGSPGAGGRLSVSASAACLAFIRYGIGPQVAVAATDTPVQLGAGGGPVIINLGGRSVDTVAVVLSAGTANVAFQRGQ